MFRFVAHDDEEQSKGVLYLEKVASQTIVDGLRACYQNEPEDDFLWMNLELYLPKDFFAGFGQYVGMDNDNAAGLTFIKVKVARMIEKMNDTEALYTFDVFEEFLFAIAIEVAQQEIQLRKAINYKKKNPYINRKRSAEVVKELTEHYGYGEKRAKAAASLVLRFDKMLPDEDEGEETNLYFWDDDYWLFFGKSMLAGIQMLKGYFGEQSGYGYEYTCEIFKDIGMRPPILLVGTEEANRIANEATEQRMVKMPRASQMQDQDNWYSDLL